MIVEADEAALKSKRVHASVMMILGAIMGVCALAAGIIASRPGAFPRWMSGGWLRSTPASVRRPAAPAFVFAKDLDAALLRAAKERRIVVLHLTTFWSRDGRVMEETTYADKDVARWLARRAIVVSVDAEERTDLARRYGVGAWPSTLLLRPDGKVLAAGSYLTPGLFLPWAQLIDERSSSRLTASDELVGKTADLLQTARASRAATSDALWAREALQREDRVWGGVYGGQGGRASGGAGFEKIGADQARFIASTADRAAARRAIEFVDHFLRTASGRYAGSARGEVDLADGGVMEGAAYFALDDARRRAIGLPALDPRPRAATCAAVARAVLNAAEATVDQKEHARQAAAGPDCRSR